MKIVHIANVDTQGGAARATYRLHRGLRELGHESRMVVRHKHSDDDSVVAIAPPDAQAAIPPDAIWASAIQHHAIDANRSDLSNTPFSFPYPGIDLSQMEAVRTADLIHLHWIVEFQSPVTLYALLSLGKPVVWTLHDMWPFTGGCHSAAGCTRYESDCAPCPQLRDDEFHLPQTILRDKHDLLVHSNLTLVAPSQNMAAMARRSWLFRHSRVEMIHHAIDTDLFFPQDKLEAKAALGLPPDGRIIAYGAEDCQQRSKGFPELVEVLQRCADDAQVQTLIAQGKLSLLCFGRVNEEAIARLPIPVINRGYIRSDDDLRTIYSAADLFFQPSLEESFGNMSIEALCCGTPVIAFDVGVISEVVQPDTTGRVVPLPNTEQMTTAVLDFIHHPKKWQAMPPHCHTAATTHFSRQTQAEHYTTLYHSLLPSNIQTFKRSNVQTFTPPPPLPHNLQTIFPDLAITCLIQEVRDTQERSPQVRQARQNLRLQRAKVETLEAQLQQTQAELEAMKSSKVWKVRSLWVALKSRLGLIRP